MVLIPNRPNPNFRFLNLLCASPKFVFLSKLYTCFCISSLGFGE